METKTEEALPLLRCPNCLRAVVPTRPGTCPRCRIVSRREKWEETTHTLPLEPEEENGGVCTRCGAPVTVQMPVRGVWTGAIGAFVMSVYFVLWGILFSVPRGGAGVHTSVIMGAVALAVATPLLFVYYRRGGASLLRNTIVFCHGCGLVRIAGREDDGEGRRFREIRSSLDFFFRPLRLAFLFFVVVWVAGWFLPGRIPPGTFMILTLTGLASYAIHSVRRRFCPPPGPWWRNLLPRPGGHR